MTNAFSLFRSLIIYGICLPLAIFIGYLLATPTDIASFVGVAFLLLMMMVPLLMRWHYPWLVAAWNSTAYFYLLPGKPPLWLLMICASFFFSSLAAVMNRNSRFISAPLMTKPLLFITAVVLFTGMATHSIGLSVLGSEQVGGKRYVFLLGAVIGYFALTAQKIPKRKANLYINMYYLGGLTAAIGNLANMINPSLYFIFLIFPPDATLVASTTAMVNYSNPVERLSGISTASVAAISWLLARYGIRGILDLKKSWRGFLFLFFVLTDLLGGFRSRAIDLILILSIMFYLEGLMRTRLLPAFLLCAILGGTVVVAFSDRMPLSIQRSLAFLPLKLDEEAIMSAQASTDWRLEMWSYVLPQVPHYLLLGKGLGIDAEELSMLTNGLNKGSETGSVSAMAGDYHNGPLSLILSFGLLGVFAFIWFLVAGHKALYRNYKYGDPDHETINRYLFAFFIVKTIVFFLVFGSFYSDLISFVGPVALSIALNGGVSTPATEPVVERATTPNRFRLASAVR